MSLDALKVPVFLKRTPESGESLVQRVRRNCTYRAAEYVRLDQPYGSLEVCTLESSVEKIVVELKQERIGDVHPQLSQVTKGLSKLLVGFFAQCHRAVIAREGVNIRDQRIYAGSGDFRRSRVGLERFVYCSNVRYLSGLKREVVPHEAVEV